MGLTARTRISSKGQMVIPRAMRAALDWDAGTELRLEKTATGMSVHADDKAKYFPPTRYEDVFGSLKYDGPPVSLEDVDRAITEEVAVRRARGRY